MHILGISAFYHDSAAALVTDGKIVAAAQEERFTRKKHDAAFPAHATRYCLEYAGLSLADLDAVVFYDKPFLKFERLLSTYYAFAPAGIASFAASMPVWIREKLFLKKVLRDELKLLPGYDHKIKLLFPEHHLSHAASAFYPSPFQSAAILTLDGVGEWATASICHGTGRNIKLLKELRFPHSLGMLYSAFTYFLGFKVNSGEYKLMGLAPYGDPSSPQVDDFVKRIHKELIEVKEDGSLWLNQKYFGYATGLRMAKDKLWENLFGFPRREAESEMQPHHCNLGLAIQRITEEVVEKMAMEAKKLTGEDNLCLAGGVALNCVANGKLQSKNIFKNIFIQPAAGDAGGAPGAALAAYHIYFEQERAERADTQDEMSGGYLGPDYSQKEIVLTARKYKAVYTEYSDREKLYAETARLLAEGSVVGWFQGRMEFGPRALGARSILGDARNPEMQKKLNVSIKFRESFRPFAPAVLAEKVKDFFEYEGISPYMLLVHPVKDNLRKPLPDNYHTLSLRDKLYFERSALPAITHIDFSARLQTVHRETNPAFHALISAFEKQTGSGVIVNTSFNVRGEPIVCTPEDAYRCFMRTNMDYLVVENFLFEKPKQPEWKESDGWKTEFVLD